MHSSVGTTLAHFADEAAELDEAALRLRYGNAFLVLLHVCRARGPRVAHATVRHMEAVRSDTAEFDIAAEMRVFALRKRPESLLPFVSIGRLDGNDIALPAEGVSKFHAYVKADANGELLLLQDGRSTNGTFVDGERVARRGEGPGVLLRPGAQVRFGNISMLFLDLNGVLRLARAMPAAVRAAS